MPTTPSDTLNRAAVEALREARGINTLAALARRAGIERTYLHRILVGERPAQPSHIVALARALMVPPIALMGPDDPAAAAAALEAV